MTLPATFFVPDFLHLARDELHILLHQLRDPLCTQVYLLIIGHCIFKTGEFLGGYDRLMELCTPPQPERGRRRSQPTYKQMRRAVADLVSAGMIERSIHNQAQGQLRLRVTKTKSTVTSIRKEGRV